MHMFYETNKLLAHIPADSETTAVNTGWIAWGSFHEVAGLASIGDLATNATLDLSVQQATDASGTGAKVITGKGGVAITFAQLTEAGGDGDDAIVFSLLAEYLDVDNGYSHIRVVVTPATAAAEFSLILFGCHPRYAPINNYAADYAQVVGP